MKKKSSQRDNRTNNLTYVLNDAENGVNNNTGLYRFETGIDVWFSDVHPYKSKDEATKMVKLIAAAPDLLEALQNLLQWANIKDGSPSQGLRDECISVIKKATE